MFALVDCNNFYVSCERVFNPKLENKAVVVLSNNDGCVISRSNEAKIFGIPMGIPFFEIEHLAKKHQIEVLSSNYTLYAHFSQRIVDCLHMFCESIEIYSIDEAFLFLTGFNPLQLIDYLSTIRKKIHQWTGIPVSIGVAPTKTLAKLANYIAKNHSSNSLCAMISKEKRINLLKKIAVEEIWGVGRKLSPKLKRLNIHTAYDLSIYPPKLLRKHFSVVIEKMAYELQGTSCLPLEMITPKKNICSSRSFGKAVTDLHELNQAISTYTAIAAQKLRAQKSYAQGICVFLQTNRFKVKENRYFNQDTLFFIEPTDDTQIITEYALALMQKLYKLNYEYSKCGLQLLNLIPNSFEQKNLFNDPLHKTNKNLMKALDEINQKFGKESVIFAIHGIQKTWQAKAEHRSPRYTTCWQELATVY